MKDRTQKTTPEILLPPPPSAVDLEKAVLGACLLDRNAFYSVVSILSEHSFSDWRHKEVFRAMLSLHSGGHPIDLLTVTERAKVEAFEVVELTNRVTSAANLEYHARILKQYEIQRRCIDTGVFLVTEGYSAEKDPLALLDKLQRETVQLTGLVGAKREVPASELALQSAKRIDRLRAAAHDLVGVPSGIDELDRLTDGFQASDLVVIAARPGMGKTSFALTLARNISMQYGKGVGFFSLEMSNEQLTTRFLSMESGVPLSRLKNPRKMDDLDLTSFTEAATSFSQAPFWLDDTPSLSILELRSKARRMVLEHKVEIIFVDYLQLMKGDIDAGNRDQEIGSISRGLKAIAKELNIPVIALSQLSRAVEARGGLKRPQLSDLRESGNIEQDSDIVGFLYRPEYYNILTDAEGNSTKGLSEFIVAKHRNGALDTIKMLFLAGLTKFCNFEEGFALQDASPDARVLTGVASGASDDIPF